MPIVFSAKLDGSEAVRYQHVSVVTFYLRQARARAESAHRMPPGEEHFAESMLAVILSALCLEAFSNEMAENSVPEAELKDFVALRGRHRKPRGLASVSWKIIKLFEKKWVHVLERDGPMIQDVQWLFDARNELVHYKMHDAAAKMYLSPPSRVTDPDTGESMTTFDFTQRPVRIELSLIVRINGAAAAKAYNTAVRVLKLWNEKAGAPPEALSAHQEIADPKQLA